MTAVDDVRMRVHACVQMHACVQTSQPGSQLTRKRLPQSIFLKRYTLRIDTLTGCAVAAESVKSGVCSSSSSLAVPLLAASRLLCNHTGRSALQKQPLVWAPPPPPPPHYLRPNKGWRVTEFVKRNCYNL